MDPELTATLLDSQAAAACHGKTVLVHGLENVKRSNHQHYQKEDMPYYRSYVCSVSNGKMAESMETGIRCRKLQSYQPVYKMHVFKVSGLAGAGILSRDPMVLKFFSIYQW